MKTKNLPLQIKFGSTQKVNFFVCSSNRAPGPPFKQEPTQNKVQYQPIQLTKTMSGVQVKHQKSPSLNDAPDEILLKIFYYLTINQKVKLRQVCKRWRRIALQRIQHLNLFSFSCCWAEEKRFQKHKPFETTLVYNEMEESALEFLIQEIGHQLQTIVIRNDSYSLDSFPSVLYNLTLENCPNLTCIDSLVGGFDLRNHLVHQFGKQLENLSVLALNSRSPTPESFNDYPDENLHKYLNPEKLKHLYLYFTDKHQVDIICKRFARGSKKNFKKLISFLLV